MAGKKEREMLKKANPDKKWAQKVDKMKFSEVVAICTRLKMQNKL